MQSLNLMLFICLAAPLSMMLFIFKGRSRAILGFLITGIFLCLFAGEINGCILNRTALSLHFITVNLTPITEEILKALPILFAAFFLKAPRQTLLEGSVAVGVGFATMENICLLTGGGALTPLLIIARGFGAGMMHGVSTLAVGYFITPKSPDKKLKLTGTIGALAVAVIYHSIYNIIVQSSYPMLGILLPILTYIPLIIILRLKQKRNTP